MQRTKTHYVNQPCTPYFPTGLVKTESAFVRSFENDLGRWTLVVAVISID